jgi:hypothetical protein
MSVAKSWKKVVLGISVVLFLVAMVGLGGVYLAIRSRPDFYEHSLEVSPVQQRKASEEMVRKATSLYNELRREGQWHALVTEEEINGWLAVDLVENHPRLLPEEVTEPRVQILPSRVEVAAQVDSERFEGVLHGTFEVSVPEPNVLALRIHAFRLGRLPVSRENVVEKLLQVARREAFETELTRQDGDPVLRVRIPLVHEKHLNGWIETIKLDQGEIYVSGSTEKRNP